MGTLTQMAGSTQDVQQEVDATLNGAPYDPAADDVAMAFMPLPPYGSGDPDDPGDGDWHEARWVTDTTGLVPTYWATCLVGPANGGVALTAGRYRIAVKVTDNPQIPYLWGWDLVIT